MPRLPRVVVGPVAAAVAAAAVLTGWSGPAAADHVSPRDISAACPPDRPGGDDDDRYSDVEGTTFEGEIACVSDYAIALGTGDARYSPSAPITRQQMALFLYRLALSAHLPLQAANTQFSDVDQLPQQVRDAINVIAHLGITQGASGGRFAPAATVSRGQMASFLNRFHAVASGTDGFPAGPDAFDDDEGSVHEDAIDAAAAAGMAAGLGGEQDRLFAPTRSLTRGQMAAFLARLLAVEVEAGTIGSRFVEPEQVDGVVVSEVDTGNRMGIDTDGDGAADRVLYYDGNDDYRFGDQPGSAVEFSDSTGGMRSVLSVGDRVAVTFLPNFFDASTVQVVDDQVGRPFRVLATVVRGDDGVQDDVRVVWVNAGRENAELTRFRSPVSTAGTCSTDETAYVEDGVPAGSSGRSDVFAPGSSPPSTSPMLVDQAVPGEGCYLYGIRSVSHLVQGSTPSEPSFTNPVLVDGTVDTEPPALTRAEFVSPDGTGGEVVFTFGNEQRVLQVGLEPLVVWCIPPGFTNGYPAGAGTGTPDGPTLTVPVNTQSPSFDPVHCDATVYPVSVIDDKGNPNVQELNAPLG